MSQSRRWIEVCGAIGLVIAFAVVQAVGQPRGRPPAAVPDTADTPPPAGTSRGENFSAKPPAQLFAADCTGAGCHRGPQGLAKGQSAFGLTSFLRQHYTNSQQSAAALASYLAGIPGDRAPAAKKQPEPKSRAAIEPDAAPKHPPAERKQPPATAKLPNRGKQATVEPTPPAPAGTPAPAAEPPAAAPAPPPAPPPPKTFDIFD